MTKHILFLSLILSGFTLKAQYLSWYASAQTGSNGLKSRGIHGAVLAGFKTQAGQQVAFGPVVKGYVVDQKFGNMVGLRLYSQMNLSGKFDAYLQCDVSNGDQFRVVNMHSPLRLETGIGMTYMAGERIGFAAGYNFGEYNPLVNTRKSSPSLKLVYLIPFAGFM